MISLKGFPHVIMEQEHTHDYPSYCLHCHVKLENDRHLQAHSSHDIHSLHDAQVKVKSNLNLTITKIEAKTNYLAQLQQSVEDFNENYHRCKEAIKATAQELCSKIMDHEKRLIAELDMYKEIEFRKNDLLGSGGLQPLQHKLQSLSRTCQVLLAESDDQQFLEQFKESRENMNLAMLDVNTGDVDLKSIQATVLDFSSIRCNTAFGTVSAAKPKTMKRRVSLRHVDSVQSLLPPSPPHVESTSPNSPSDTEESTVKIGHTLNKGAKFFQRKLSLQHFHTPTRNVFSFRDVDRKSPSPEMRLSPTLPSEQPLAPCEETDEHLQLLWTKESEGPELGQINCPTDVTFLPDNTLVVCDRGNMRLQLFNTDGKALKVIGEKKIQPYRVNTTPAGQIILTDSKDSCVKVYDKKGHSVFTLGKKSLIASTSFKAPCAVAQNNKKQFIVSDLESNQVNMYGRDAKSQLQLDFKKPSYISTDKTGRILVSDNLDHCVKVYDSSFEYLFQCTLANQPDCDETEDYLAYPTGGCFDNEGNIYVADWGKHTVTMFDKEGIFIKQLLSKQDGLYHPGGVAVADGFLAVTNFSESHSSVMLYRIL